MSNKPHVNILDLFDNADVVKVCAPMVRYSKLQFRNLVKLYNCDLVFTPMILADSFCCSNDARKNEFTTNMFDVPLITQFAANTIHDFVGASYMVSPYCDGVDLNCGCPQRWAKEQCVGCELLNKPQIIYDLVKECRNTIGKPFTVSVKLRLKKNVKDTMEICRNLENCGVSFLTVHARTKEQITGSINEEALRLIVENTTIPIIGNGGMNTLTDCIDMKEKTGVKGTMVANGILQNPMLFSGQNLTTIECIQNWIDICFNSTLTFDEYEKLTHQKYANGFIREKPRNLTFQCFHHHLVFMLEKVLTRRNRQIFNNLRTFKEVQGFIESHFDIKPKLFTYERFRQSQITDICYSDSSKFYNDLKPQIVNSFNYNYADNDGKYFTNKVQQDDNEMCDWSDIFLENG